MGNLIKLHHLNNSNTDSLEEMPLGIGKLTCLLTLCNFVVGKDSGSGLRELKLLTHLCGTLNISKLENVKYVGDAMEAQLDGKKNLKVLMLEWTRSTNGLSSREAQTEKGVLDMLKPHRSLEQFCISGFEGNIANTSYFIGYTCRSKLLGIVITSLPALCKLRIDRCKKVVWRSTTDCESQLYKDISNQMFLGGPVKLQLPKLDELDISIIIDGLSYIWQNETQLLQDIATLKRLKIERCPKLQFLEEEDQWQFGLSFRLEHLELINCQDLEKLPKSLLSLSSLTEMRIHNCSSLVSFPEAVLPSQLRVISIWDCGALKFLPEAWMLDNNSSLEILDIRHCHLLTYIAGVQLPPSLKQLEIYNCDNLRTLTAEEGIHSSRRHTSLLECLEIHSCPSLTCLISKNEFPAALDYLVVGNLPQALKFLSIWHCSKLESIVERLDNKISLEDCENLVSFPEGGLLSAKLKRLVIYGCKKLEALPEGMHNLSSLQHLTIGGVPSLLCFTEDGLFPTNLHSLEIDGMKIWKSLMQLGGFHRYTSLRRLAISGCDEDMVSFPLEDIRLGTTLPACLTQLEIFNFPNLERLSSSICDQNLTSLKLTNCPKLKYFPEKGLPASLLRLEIKKCPLIEKMCRQDIGPYWHLIMTRGIGMNSIDRTGFLSVTFNLPQVLDAST
ncbi:hypothetical protein CUMW_232020 [Citrus unshiu]|nr:hypothetical protein CUMW_232020 [Citrus unshiu]